MISLGALCNSITGALLQFTLILAVISRCLQELTALIPPPTIDLDGSKNSYVKFSPLTASSCKNFSVAFEYLTTRPSALLLYTELGPPEISGVEWRSPPHTGFLELRLVRGVVVLRFNYGGSRSDGGGGFGRTAGGRSGGGDAWGGEGGRAGVGSEVREKAFTITASDYVHHDRWHSVIISRAGFQTTLAVDGVTHSQPTITPPSRNLNQRPSGSPATVGVKVSPSTKSLSDSFLYIGGVPLVHEDKLDRLLLPSVVYERHLQGSVRHLTYSRCGGAGVDGGGGSGGGGGTEEGWTPRMLDSDGVRTNTDDACADHNPCQNNGECISTDVGPLCDCSLTDYNGTLCHTKKRPHEITLLGSEFFGYDLTPRADGIVGQADLVRMSFITSQSNALLFFTGDGDGDFVEVTLKDGALVVRIGRRPDSGSSVLTPALTSGPLTSAASTAAFETEIRPTAGHLTDNNNDNSNNNNNNNGSAPGYNDNNWHSLSVSRESREISIQVDDGKKYTGTIVGDFQLFSSKLLYVGGVPTSVSFNRLPSSSSSRRYDNFRGCLSQLLGKINSPRFLTYETLNPAPIVFRCVSFDILSSRLPTSDAASIGFSHRSKGVSWVAINEHLERSSVGQSIRVQTRQRGVLVVFDSAFAVLSSQITATRGGSREVEDGGEGVGEIGTGLLFTHGAMLMDKCADDIAALQAVNFQTEYSYIELPPLKRVARDRQAPGVKLGPAGQLGAAAAISIQFQIQTTEPNGLVMYGLGMKQSSDCIAFELLDGLLYFHLDLGAGTTSVRASHLRLDDGVIHQVVLVHDILRGYIRVDELERRYVVTGYVEGQEEPVLDLEDGIYVGGISEWHQDRLPLVIWSASLQSGYVGCFSDLIINSDRINLVKLSREQEVIGETCSLTSAQCSTYPCLHHGTCRDGWGRFVCDCSATSYRGDTCRMLAVTLTFDGTQSALVSLPAERLAHTNDISLRVATFKPEGLLLITWSDATTDRVEMSLSAGRVRLTVTMGAETQTVVSGQSAPLNDGRWHTVYVRHRGSLIDLNVDNTSVARAARLEFSSKHRALSFNRLELGGRTLQRSPRHMTSRDRRQQATGPPSPASFVTSSGYPSSSSSSSSSSPADKYIGKMQQLHVNRNEYFELLRTGGGDGGGGGRGGGGGGGGGSIISTATTEKMDGGPVTNQVTFKSAEAFIVTKLRIHSTFNIFFQIKTTQSDGLLLFAGGSDSSPAKDFLAVELVGGHVRYSYDVGNRPRNITVTLRHAVNDNRWHDVSIIHPVLTQHVLRVDDSAVTDTLPDARSIHFDMTDDLYVGGVPPSMYSGLPKLVKSREGFQGCLASVDLDGDIRNLLEQSISVVTEYRDDIVTGCEGPSRECDEWSCDNGGRCVQEWNTYTCDCDMTSFSGHTCADDGVAYSFGSKGGLITFTFSTNERVDSRKDLLAFGFITTQRDAILVRVVSANSNDYIELEIVEGNMFAVYNMGMMDQPLGELSVKVNDGNYHVVRLTRLGPNATLQLDDLPEIYKYPSGRQLTTFNNIAQVYVGGKRDVMGRPLRSFTGTIAGLVLNGQKILDAVAEGDGRMKIEGDVELQVKPLRPYHSKLPFITTRANQRSTSFPNTTSSKSPDKFPKEVDCNKKDGGCKTSLNVSTIHPSYLNSSSSSSLSSSSLKPSSSTSDKYSPSERKLPKPSSSSSLPSSSPIICRPNDGDDCDLSDQNFLPLPPSHSLDGDTGRSSDGRVDSPTGLQTTQSPTKPALPLLSHVDTRESSGGTKQSAVSDTPTTTIAKATKGSAAVIDGAGGDQNKRGVGFMSGTVIAIIVGAAVGALVLISLLAYAVYKYRSRDEGSYKIEESNNYGYEACNSKPMAHLNGRVKTKHKRKEIEWYV